MTLHFYFARKFFLYVLTTLAILTILITLIDLVEHARRYSNSLNFNEVLRLTILNTPKSVYEVIDLIMLISSIAFFGSISKSSELIVVRGSGRSVYGTLLSPLCISLFLGCIFVALFNPLVATSSKSYLNMKEILIKGNQSVFSVGSEGLWLRQGTNAQQSVIRATMTNVDASTLYNVTIISFDKDGAVSKRIEAESAKISEKDWHLTNAKIWPIGKGINSEKKSKKLEKLIIESSITKEEITERFGEPHMISIWNLRTHIAQLKSVGFSMRRYEVRYQSELSHPIFLAAMMLVGCAFTMKKFVGNRKGFAIIASILLGFCLFYVRNFSALLAEGNQLNLITATWIPTISSILISLGIIIHVEDG